MRKTLMTFTAAAALAGGVGVLTTAAQAAPFTPSMISPLQAVTQNPLAENVQLFLFGGRRYCWYFDGWHGPGWYWCGYQFRRGFGWGGPAGFRGWRPPGGPRGRAFPGGPGPRGFPGGRGPGRGPGGFPGGHGPGPGGFPGGHGPGPGGHGPGPGGHGPGGHHP